MQWWALGIGAALVIGAVASVDPMAATLIVGVVALALLTSFRIAAVPAVLVLVAFIDFIPSSLMFLALFVVVAELALGRSRILFESPAAWVCAYVLWALASALWTVSVDRTLFSLQALALGITFALVLATLIASRSDLRIVLHTLVFAVLISGSYAVAAYALGLGVATIGEAVDSNTFALHQVMALPLVLVAAANARTRSLRLVFFVVALVVVGSIFASLSRGAVLALAAVVAAMILVPTGALLRSRAQRIAVPVFIVAGVVLSLVLVSNDFLSRLELIDQGEAAGSGRVNLWRAGLTAAEERPVLGLGYGGFFTESNEVMRRTPGVDLVRFPLVRDGLRAHNTYISTLSELGLIGLGLLLGLLVATALALRRVSKAARDVGEHLVAGTANALLLSLLVWAILSVFLAAENTFAFWLIVGLALTLPKLLTDDGRLSPPPAVGR